MVCLQDIGTWFRHARGSERIETLCALLQLCNPLELRFLGTCVEDLAKKDFNSLREEEIKANDSAQLRALCEGSVFDERTRSKLLFSVSLLYSLNTVCAHVLYEVLNQIQTEILQHHATALEGHNQLLNPRFVEDALLVYTMATNHPAFTFNERQKLYVIFKNIEQLIADFLVKVEAARNSQTLPTPQTEGPNPDKSAPSEEPSEDQPITNHVDMKSNHIDEKPPEKPRSKSPLKPSHVKGIDVKGSHLAHNSRKPEFTLQVSWSIGDDTEVSFTYQELHHFHKSLLRSFPKESNAHKSERVMPYFPQDKGQQGSQPKGVVEALRKYFCQLTATPFISSHHVAEFFLTGRKSPKSDPGKPRSHSHSSSSASPNQASLNSNSHELPATNTPHLTIPSANTDVPSAKSSLVPTGHMVTTQVTQRHAYSQPSSARSPSPPQCIHSPVSSPVQCSGSFPSWPAVSDSLVSIPSPNPPQSETNVQQSVRDWLKGIRLHKYSKKFEKYSSLDQLQQLTEKELKDKGLTQGAITKFVNELGKLKVVTQKNGMVKVGVKPPGNSISNNAQLDPSSGPPPTACSPESRSALANDTHSLDGVDSSCSEYSSPPHSPNQASQTEAADNKAAALLMPAERAPLLPDDPSKVPSVKTSLNSIVPPQTYALPMDHKSMGVMGNIPPLPPPPPYGHRMPIHFMPPRPMLPPQQRSPRMQMQRPPLLVNKNCPSPDQSVTSSGMKSSLSCPQIQEASSSPDPFKFNGPMMGTSLVNVCSRPSSLGVPTVVSSTQITSASPPLMVSSTDTSSPPTPRQTPPLTSTPSSSECSCNCSHNRPPQPPPVQFAGHMWAGMPMPMMHLPPNGLPFPEVMFNNQANFVMTQHRPPLALPLNGAGLLGQHPLASQSSNHYPMHAPQSGLLMGQQNIHTMYTKHMRGPMCCNCGANGHRGTECKESTFDMMTRSGQYHLNLAPKSESE